MPPSRIAVSVIVTTLNEERNLARCLSALERFDEIIIVDSGSTDNTSQIAASSGARVMPFLWNGRYPKKRQWCLDHLNIKHDWVFFVDADEEVTPELVAEIASLDLGPGGFRGYFVKGAYVVDGRVLRFGLKNSKLCLFHKKAFRFPEIDDLDAPGMGEMEGHYQPVAVGAANIGRLENCLLHHAFEDMVRWDARHDGYAAWHRAVLKKAALPQDPAFIRRCFKGIFYHVPVRPLAAFLHSYILMLGCLDGYRGFFLARSRYLYYRK